KVLAESAPGTPTSTSSDFSKWLIRLHRSAPSANHFSAATDCGLASVIGTVGKGHPQAILRTPRDAAPMRAAVRCDAQHELVGDGHNFHPGDLGTAIGKVAYDAFTGKIVIAIVHLGR